MIGLVEFLASCEYVYTHGTPLTVENCKLFISSVRTAIETREINDAYLYDPQYFAHRSDKRH
jgi:hypothetical protein